jgi:hypothetical protein
VAALIHAIVILVSGRATVTIYVLAARELEKSE